MSFGKSYRTHRLNELRASDIGSEVKIAGWVSKKRDLGALYFVDLRDKYGVTQLNFSELSEETKASALKLTLESVVWVKGKVQERPSKNSDIPTGDVEVAVTEYEVLSKADEPPFLPYGQMDATEDLKLKYRYLDIRGSYLQKMIALRSKAARKCREVLYSKDFVEVETPVLYKSTPEGARDFLVPSRIHHGKVYALPQSPQTLKQLLMIGGTDRYFQIVKCFRDEDLRADRQPEFTQIDIEASFVKEEDIKELGWGLVKNVFELPKDEDIETMSFDEAMEFYGSDKPDLRFGLRHRVLNTVFKNSDFKVFSGPANNEGLVKGFFVPKEQADLKRKQIDGYTELVKTWGAPGLAWFKQTSEGISGGVSKFITKENLSDLGEKNEGTWLFFAGENTDLVHALSDRIRRKIADDFSLREEGYKFIWIHSFPLFEYSEEDKRLVARHHPFTSPHEDDLEVFLSSSNDKELLKCKAQAYDLVCNGYELGGGSIRIFNSEVQKKMFERLGMSEEEALHQFGFFMEALRYGTPPHGGMAFGFDRIVMLLAGTNNIRDVIAFPKTASAADLMASAPSRPAGKQLEELGLRTLT